MSEFTGLDDFLDLLLHYVILVPAIQVGLSKALQALLLASVVIVGEHFPVLDLGILERHLPQPLIEKWVFTFLQNLVLVENGYLVILYQNLKIVFQFLVVSGIDISLDAIWIRW